MYKIYFNPLFSRPSETGKGGRVSEIDYTDLAAVSDNPASFQTLDGTSDDFSRMKRYLILPDKCVAMVVPGGKRMADISTSNQK